MNQLPIENDFQSPTNASKFRKDFAVFSRISSYEKYATYISLPLSFVPGVYLFGRESLSMVFFTAFLVFLIVWFFLIYFPTKLLFQIFWLTRAKCPNCNQRFSTKIAGILPGHIFVNYVIPNNCSKCGIEF